MDKFTLPEYDNSIVSLASSIRRYFELDVYHNTLSDIDKILEEYKPKNVVVILFDGMGSILIKKILGENSFLYRNMLKEISKSIVNDVVKETTILDNNIIINKNNSSFVNLIKKDDYKVYIYNTHDEESYSNKGFELYNTTPTVKLASYMLKDELKNLGINALVEERPVIKEIKKQGLPYHYSYDISNKYCKEIKEKYPSIIYFIDLHRDGIDKSLSTVTINNKTYAKMMFLLGMKHSNSNKNLEVVTKLNNYLNDNYKGLMRNIYKRNDITYYQYFDSHNFIIEIGGQDNTYQEVYNSIKAFAKALESDLK